MIDLKVVGSFFDQDKVIRAADRATRRVLSRFGAYVRTSARHSIRRRKATSKPGQPPSSHTGLLRRHIYFSYDARARDVVIGPVPMGAKTSAPETLEHGGRVVQRRRGRRQTLAYAARPYMGPALRKELPKLGGMWANSIR